MNLWRWIVGASIALTAMLPVSIGGWIWARDDFFPSQLTLSAPPQGPNRAAVVSDSDLQGDANHSVRLHRGGGWRKWTDVGTQSEMADQNWKLIWSRDGSLVAIKEAPGMTGNPLVTKWIYSSAYDWKRRKFHESLDGWQEQARSPFSRRIDAMMKQRGGAVAGLETRRDVGVWRWQDRALKDAL